MKYHHPRRSLPGLLSTLVALGCSVAPAWASPCFQVEESAAEEIEPVDQAMRRFGRLNGELGALFFAVEVGNDARALRLIAGGLDLSPKWNGESIMDLVVKRGRLAVFRELVDVGVAPVLSTGRKVEAADVSEESQYPPPARITDQEIWDWHRPGFEIVAAAMRGNEDAVTLLLVRGDDVNTLLKDGTSALHAAVAEGHGKVAELLITAGAKIDLRGGPLGRTPLELALQSRGNDQTIRALMGAGVKLVHDQEDARGTTLLHLASQNGYLHIMRELIASGAITNAKSYLTPAKKKLVDTPVLAAVKNDETDAVVMLVLRGAELNVQDHLGGTPLWHAMGAHDGTTTRMLIDGGADPNMGGQDGEPPLIEALRTGKEEKVRVLLQMGADPDATYKGMTGLHVVAKGGTWEMATWLLDAGAIRSMPNAQSQTPFELAVRSGNDMVAHVLVSGSSDALVLAVGTMDLPAMRRALQLGANPTQTLSDGSTPMHQFARQGEKGFEAAKLFLIAGASPNATDDGGNTPLSELIHEKAHIPFIKLLMAAGADPRRGAQSARALAQRMEDEDLIELLSQRPGIPKVNVITRSGFPHPAAQAASACEAYAGLGDYDNALKQADLAVRAKPTNGRYRLYRAKLRAAAGDAQGSLVDYSILLRDKPSWFDPKVDYGILLIQNEFYREGLDHLNEVLTRFVGRPDAKLHLNRGRAREALGDHAGALEDLELAHQTAPGNGEILRYLGLTQKSLGNRQGACASWNKALQAGDQESATLIEQNCQD